jgi:hypothetical protein
LWLAFHVFDGDSAIVLSEVDKRRASNRGARVASKERGAFLWAVGYRYTLALRDMVDKLAYRPCMNRPRATGGDALLLRLANVKRHVGEDNIGAMVDNATVYTYRPIATI